MLDLNGYFPVDTLYKPDRHIAKARAEELLRRGGNVLLFPEGAFNISPNRLLMYLYAGAVELAITCNVEIIPMAIVRDGKTYYVNFGKNLSYEGLSPDQRFESTDLQRGKMAALVWEVLEQLPIQNRASLPSDYYEKNYLGEMMGTQVDGYSYSVQDINDTLFWPKNLIEPETAFTFMDKLIPSRENAFLFSKRLSPIP